MQSCYPGHEHIVLAAVDARLVKAEFGRIARGQGDGGVVLVHCQTFPGHCHIPGDVILYAAGNGDEDVREIVQHDVAAVTGIAESVQVPAPEGIRAEGLQQIPVHGQASVHKQLRGGVFQIFQVRGLNR